MEEVIEKALGKLGNSFIIEKPKNSILTLVKRNDSDLIVDLSVTRGPTHYVAVSTNITGIYKTGYTKHKKALVIANKIRDYFKKCDELKGRIEFKKDVT